MYLMFLGPLLEGGDFRDEGVSGPRRFLDKVWTLVTEAIASDNGEHSAPPDPDSRLGPAQSRGAAEAPPEGPL